MASSTFPKSRVIGYDEAPLNPVIPPRPADLAKADLSEIARTVLAKRYLLKDDSGKPIEEPEDMFWRVAYWIAYEDTRYGASEADVMKTARAFYQLMAQGLWEPNSPTLMNAGRPLGQLSACFVLPVADCLSNGTDGIYDTLRAMALVHQSGGGTGFSFSRLRPKNSLVRSTMGVASGPVSFMTLFDASTEVVTQGGTRRGANMGILRVDHPDIRDFIACKSDVTKITNFNISVGVTDAFMEAVKRGEKYDLIDPRTKKVVGQEDAREIFDLIVHGAWATGEPGVFFIDEANKFNPVPHLGEYEATNPCGEQPLLPWDVCNLGSVNLGAFFRAQPVDESEVPEFLRGQDWARHVDWVVLERVIFVSTHFLDNVIDANRYPLAQIHDLAQRIRRIGAGVMGLADLLVRLGVPYDSPQGVEVSGAIARFFDEKGKDASEDLAKTRGVFPEWEKSIWGPDATCARDAKGNRIRPMRRLRNCNVNTVAPTGTISMIAGCSSGIEPLFAVAFMRNQAGALMADVNPDFVRVAKEQGWYSEELMNRIASEGHIHFPEVPAEVQATFRTAHDITPEWHVRMQAAWQDHIDSAISKTTNFPNEASEQDVREIYELAFELNCKGVTVYRDGCRPNQVLSTGKTSTAADVKKAEDALAKAEERIEALVAENSDLQRRIQEAAATGRKAKRSRPEVMTGITRKKETPLGTAFITINEDETGQPFEVFVTLGKAGGAAMADAEGIGRLISLALRQGVSLDDIVRQLRGISSDRAVGFGPNKVLSVPDAIAQALQAYARDKQGVQEEFDLGLEPAKKGEALPGTEDIGGACPDCGAQLAYIEGCLSCSVRCGFSKCG